MDTGSDEEEQEVDPQVADDSVHSFEGHRGMSRATPNASIPGVPDTMSSPHVDTVYAVAWNPAHLLQVATGGGDDKAFLWQAYLSTSVSSLFEAQSA